MDGGQSRSRFKGGRVGIAQGTSSADPSQAFRGYLESGLASKDPAQCRQGGRIEAVAGFLVQLAFGGQSCAASQTPGALRVGDQFAQPQENMLITSEASSTGFLHHLGQGVRRQGGDVSAYTGMA